MNPVSSAIETPTVAAPAEIRERAPRRRIRLEYAPSLAPNGCLGRCGYRVPNYGDAG